MKIKTKYNEFFAAYIESILDEKGINPHPGGNIWNGALPDILLFSNEGYGEFSGNGDHSIYKDYIFLEPTDFLEQILDLPVKPKQIDLPSISGYKTYIENDVLHIGCQKIEKAKFVQLMKELRDWRESEGSYPEIQIKTIYDQELGGIFEKIASRKGFNVNFRFKNGPIYFRCNSVFKIPTLGTAQEGSLIISDSEDLTPGQFLDQLLNFKKEKPFVTLDGYFPEEYGINTTDDGIRISWNGIGLSSSSIDVSFETLENIEKNFG